MNDTRVDVSSHCNSPVFIVVRGVSSKFLLTTSSPKPYGQLQSKIYRNNPYLLPNASCSKIISWKTILPRA